MTSNQNCRYEVEWVTEYACHRDYLESNSCRLTGKQHDISIDLTPLTTTGTQAFHMHIWFLEDAFILKGVCEAVLQQQDGGGNLCLYHQPKGRSFRKTF